MQVEQAHPRRAALALVAGGVQRHAAGCERGQVQKAPTGAAQPRVNFLRIVRGVLLKGSGWSEIAPDIWPIVLFMLVAGAVALNRYRETLD